MSRVMRAIIRGSDGTSTCQEVQLEILDDPRDDVEMFEPFGVSFRPARDAETLAVAVNDDDGHLVALGASGRGKRPQDAIEEGEGGLYYAGVYRVFVKADGTTLFGAMDATEAMLLGDLTKTAYDTHAHSTPFGPTGGPITPLPSSCLSTVAKVK